MDNKKKYDNNGIYATEDIIELFWGLLKEGYTGLGFGLILDLIEDRLEDTRQTKQEDLDKCRLGCVCDSEEEEAN
jgi:hypothetical protein